MDRRCLGWVVVALGWPALLVAAPGAWAQTTATKGVVSGRAVDGAGHGVAHVDVHVVPVGDGTGAQGYAFTAADGSYTTTAIAPGRYTVEFAPTDGHVRTFYPAAINTRRSTPVTVRAAATTAGIDTTLALGGSITGRVTDATGAPVVQGYVGVDFDGFAGEDHGERGSWTADDGTYRIQGLRPGSYVVDFGGPVDSGLLGEYYDDRPVGEGVHEVAVTAGHVVAGIDASLGLGGTIRGRVTGAGGEPVEGAYVLADALAGFGYGKQVETGADGTYEITGTWPGATTVSVRPPLGSPYAARYFGGAQRLQDARPVVTREGAVTSGVDVQVPAGRMITGRVTDARGAPVKDVRVSAARPGGVFERLRDTYTLADGTYALGPLSPGDYAVAFQPAFGDLVAQYRGGGATIAHARATTLDAGGDATGVDATLADGATIRGRLTDESGGAPLHYADATVVPLATDELLDFHATRFADEDGEYVVEGLRPGSYAVRFDSPVDRDMATEWSRDSPDEAHATRVELAAGATGVIDGTMHDRAGPSPAPGHAAGRVTDGAGRPVAGALVTAMTSTGSERGTALTAADGTYTTRDLEPGAYRLRISAPGRISELYDDAASLDGSRPLTIAAGATLGGIDVALGATSVAPGDEPPVDVPPVTTEPPTTAPPQVPAPGAPGAPAGEVPAALDALLPGAPPGPAAGGVPAVPAVPAVPPVRLVAVAGRAVVPSGRRARVRGGRVGLRLSCPGTATCRGTLRLVRRSGGHAVTVAAGRFAVAGGAKATVRLRVTARGRELVRGRRLPVSVLLPSGGRTARLVLVG